MRQHDQTGVMYDILACLQGIRALADVYCRFYVHLNLGVLNLLEELAGVNFL